jgi:hypothetical protein
MGQERRNANTTPADSRYCSILGGTYTLIGTSKNLVMAGLLKSRFQDDPNVQLGLFDVSVYSVPRCFCGHTLYFLASTWLPPGGGGKDSGVPTVLGCEGIVLRAKLMPWSTAGGRSLNVPDCATRVGYTWSVSIVQPEEA